MYIPPYPRKSYRSDPAAQHVAYESRIRVSGREKRMKLRRAPVCNAGHDNVLHVGEHRLPIFTFDRSLGRHQFVQISRFDGGQNGPETSVFFIFFNFKWKYILRNMVIIIPGRRYVYIMYYYLRALITSVIHYNISAIATTKKGVFYTCLGYCPCSLRCSQWRSFQIL